MDNDSVFPRHLHGLVQIEGGLRLSTPAVGVASAVRSVSCASLVARFFILFSPLHNGHQRRGSALDGGCHGETGSGPGRPRVVRCRILSNLDDVEAHIHEAKQTLDGISHGRQLGWCCSRGNSRHERFSAWPCGRPRKSSDCSSTRRGGGFCYFSLFGRSRLCDRGNAWSVAAGEIRCAYMLSAYAVLEVDSTDSELCLAADGIRSVETPVSPS